MSERAVQWFKQKGSAAIAFSGGVDSAFLLACAVEALGDKAIAVTVRSAFFPEWERSDASEVAYRLGARHIELDADVLADEQIATNDEQRCYYCKRRVFGSIIEEAAIQGIDTVCDGSNADDVNDYRPGARAAQELGVHSPLRELGYTKREIRAASAVMGLPTATKPAYACLATRIPTGEKLTDERLRRIEAAEDYLHRRGFAAVRVRDHGDMARIELAQDDMAAFLQQDFSAIDSELKQAGYRFVTLDLAGYRMGSMNRGTT